MAGTIVKQTITQAMIDDGADVLVPLPWIPTAAIGCIAGGAEVSDLVSVDGTARVTIAMSDGANPSPFRDGCVVVLTIAK